MRPLRFLRLTPSLLDEGKCIFFESSTLKFFSNSSIIQKISVTLSLVIIAYIICNYLIFTYKDTKYLRDYQFLCMLFYPELTYSLYLYEPFAVGKLIVEEIITPSLSCRFLPSLSCKAPVRCQSVRSACRQVAWPCRGWRRSP